MQALCYIYMEFHRDFMRMSCQVSFAYLGVRHRGGTYTPVGFWRSKAAAPRRVQPPGPYLAGCVALALACMAM